MTALMTVLFVAGVGLLSFGAWLAWPPAGFVVAGLVLLLVTLTWARGETRKQA